MTISKLFEIICKIISLPILFYWVIRLYFINDGVDTFKEISVNSLFFLLSFAIFIAVILFFIVCFIVYLSKNSEKAAVIVLAPSYIYKNFWRTLNL